MFKNFLSACATFMVAQAKTTMILSPPESDAEEQALIFIHGMDCNPTVYEPLVTEY
jgi:hypothetical protein